MESAQPRLLNDPCKGCRITKSLQGRVGGFRCEYRGFGFRTKGLHCVIWVP